MKSPAELTEVFRRQGLKVTPQRLAVFAALHGGDCSHPTADSVYRTVVRDLPTVSLRTVYAVLTELSELGEIASIDVGTGATRFDPNVDGHHHVVCDSCGAIFDVAVDRLTVSPLGSPDGFDIRSTEVVFRGQCGDCRTTSNLSTPNNTKTESS